MKNKPTLSLNDIDVILTPQDAAEYLKSSTSTLAKLRMRGDGPEYQKMGNRIRYRKSSLDHFIEARTFHNTGQYKSTNEGE